MNLAGLKRQVTLERTLREGERLHPPLILLIRKVLRAPELCGPHRACRRPGRRVPGGLASFGSPVCRSPDRFEPERFAPPRSEDKQHHYTLIGFGGGKHRCMGEKFAMLQLKAIWTVLLDRFDFDPVAEFPAPNYGSWVTGPREPCRVRYRRRSQASLFR